MRPTPRFGWLFDGIRSRILPIFFLIPFVVVLLVHYIIFGLIIRPAVWFMYKIFRPDLKGFVNGVNVVFTQGKDSNFPLNIVGIVVSNGKVTVSDFQESMQERILSLKKSNGDILYEELQTYWIKFLGYPFWKKDNDFDLKNHIREYDYKGHSLPSEPSELDLHNAVGKLIQAPWKKHRSPWEILFIHNYKGQDRLVHILRINHVLADGLSIYEMYRILTQSEWRVPGVQLSERTLSKWDRLRLAFKMPYDAIVIPLRGFSVRRLPFQKENTNVEIILTVSPEISVDVIKSIKNYFKVNYAAVMYSATTGAIARALERAGQHVPKYYMASIIVPRPKHPGGLCIHAEILMVKFPLRSLSPEKRLKKIQECLKSLSNSTAGRVYNALAKTLTVFPCEVLTSGAKLSDSMFGTLTVAYANVPVTVGPDYYKGIEISELTTATSIINNVGMMISMGGVNNKQRVSFCINKNMFESEDIGRSMGTFFAEEIQALVNATT